MQLRRCNRCDSPITYEAEMCHSCGNRKLVPLMQKEIIPLALKVLLYPFVALLLFLFLGPAIFNLIFWRDKQNPRSQA